MIRILRNGASLLYEGLFSIAKGMSTIGFFPNTRIAEKYYGSVEEIINRTPEEALRIDREAIAGNWEKVGMDMGDVLAESDRIFAEWKERQFQKMLKERAQKSHPK